MTINKRRKNSRQRGSKTHGWGAMKKHRGTGNRGGKGNASSGKRSDAKKPSNWEDPKYFGKHGFTSKSRTSVQGMNISYLDAHADRLTNQKLISKENGVYVVELPKLGYNKLLGSGKVKNKFKITVPYASANAVEKVQQAGGQVTIE